MFVIGLGVAGSMSYELLHKNAQDEGAAQRRRDDGSGAFHARLHRRQGAAAPAYDPDKFLPQSVPAFAATEIMHLLRKKYPDYAYKEAALNPTNPRNKAVDWESDILNTFRSDARARRCRACATRRPGARSTWRGRSRSATRRASSCHTKPEHGAAGDGEALRPEQRLRLEAERGDRRADRVGADGAADREREPRVRHLHELARGGVRVLFVHRST